MTDKREPRKTDRKRGDTAGRRRSINVRDAERAAMPARPQKGPGASLPAEIKKPIYIDPMPWGLLSGRTSAELKDEVFKRRTEKLLLLLKHYNINLSSPDKWLMLCWSLAAELGVMEVIFEPPRRRGRSNVWTIDRQRSLVKDVEEICAERGKGVSDAVRVLVKRKEEWAKYRESPEQLETRHSEARRFLEKLPPGLVSLWETWIAEGRVVDVPLEPGTIINNEK